MQEQGTSGAHPAVDTGVNTLPSTVSGTQEITDKCKPPFQTLISSQPFVCVLLLSILLRV